MTTENKNQPAFDLVHVVENAEGKPFFQKIGALFATKKGDGYLVVLNYMPLDQGRIITRPFKAKEEADT